MAKGVVSGWGAPFLFPFNFNIAAIIPGDCFKIEDKKSSERSVLNMSEFSAKDKQIFEDMKQCIEDLGLKILDEKIEDGHLSGFSMFEYLDHNLGIIFYYNTSFNVAEVFLRYADMPAQKLPALCELINSINGNLTCNHFYIDPVTRILVLRSGLYVTGYFLNKEAFKMVMKQNLGVGYTFISLVSELIFTGQSPKSIMDEFYANKDKVPLEFLGPDGKVKEPEITKDCPFTIDVCIDMPAFPTHTHGLTELGMPEFLIDHLCMGSEGNAGFINASYKYFRKPENAGKLADIKSGKTVKLTPEDLKPDIKPSKLIYCCRRVFPEFEMVKHAYNIEDSKDVDANMWFIQIYVEGDDFALTDDYYKGGIKF